MSIIKGRKISLVSCLSYNPPIALSLTSSIPKTSQPWNGTPSPRLTSVPDSAYPRKSDSMPQWSLDASQRTAKTSSALPRSTWPRRSSSTFLAVRAPGLNASFFFLSKVVFQGFGSLLFGGAIICFVAWFVRPLTMRCETDGFIRKPLGEPAPQASNLALAIVLLVVIVIQAIFNAWQGETHIPFPFILHA